MNRLGRTFIYGLLAIFALATLVPFAYLACSSIKTKAVFFSSPFLPTSGLFQIEPSTGSLRLVDTTHLRGRDKAEFELTLEAVDTRDDEVAARALIRASVTRIPKSKNDAPAYEITLTDEKGRPISETTDRLPHGDQALQYRLVQGNPRGLLGIAWGQITGDHYKNLVTDMRPSFLRYAVNSFFFASASAVLGTLFSAMGGYALAKFHFRGRKVITDLVLGSLIVPGAVMLAPLYQLIYWFGLLDTYAGMILPAMAPAFGVYLFRQAMVNGLPTEMMEAARIDGCGEVSMFFTMALPMVRPMIGAFLMITYLGAWNNFIWPQIILQSPEKFPLAVGIAQMRDVYSADYGRLMAGTLASILPVLLLFLMLQKEFIAGLTAGAVKG